MEYLIKIFLAVLFGGILGAERGHAGKAAGFRTYTLVTLAATLFTIISKDANIFFQSSVYDPGRVMSQVLLGIGFIGAGIIFHNKEHIQGLTTAAGLWMATAIGMAIGIEQYFLAAIITLVSFLILTIFLGIEEKIEDKK